MRKFFFLIFSIWVTKAQAQPYQNEWIDYQKTYYKFLIGSDGLYRINQPLLSSVGLGSTPVEYFQLWRNGEQVPLYTSVPSGPMGIADYLEFVGSMNDGRPDKILYRNPDHQLNEKWSLETDTAAYFLTVNPSGPNLRLVNTPNNLPVSGTPESFFYHSTGIYYKQRINPGFAAIVGTAVYSSNYDPGEGWTSTDIGSQSVRTETFNGLFPFIGSGANAPTLSVAATGNSPNPRSFSVVVNNTQLDQTIMNQYDYVRRSIQVPTSLIATGNATVEIKNLSSVNPDRMAIAQIELTYPRLFNFGGAALFSFQLANGSAGNYLEIAGFSHGGVPPVLYDLTNRQRYVCDISNPGLVKVQLQPAAGPRRLQLISQVSGMAQTVGSLQVRQFVDYAAAARQGNYLIITHSSLLQGAGGSTPVEDYRSYRSSVAGGGHLAKVYLIDQLVDQFAYGIRLHPLSVRNFIRYARARFSTPVKNVLMIGKGVEYVANRSSLSDPNLERLSFIPTFGYPASDILLAADPGMDVRPKVSIGRLSVIEPYEISTYLSKLIQYEQQLSFQSPSIRDKAWNKNIVHVNGSSDASLGEILANSLREFKRLVSDTLYGAQVHEFSKLSTAPVEQANAARLYGLFEEGIGMLTYFGHSSATTLEFNLDDPGGYNNPGKYPVFSLLGCNAGNFYSYNLQRLFSRETISEKFVLAPNRGSIATIASTGLGIVNYLDIYQRQFYRSAAQLLYGRTLGELMQATIAQVFQQTSQDDFFSRVHCEQTTLHGDPALRLTGSATKPDYVLEDAQVKVSPSFVSVADASFQLEAVIINLGKAVNTPLVVEVKQTYPDNRTQTIFRDTIDGIRYSDTLRFQVPILASRDKGLNRLSICVDADLRVDESFETNNCVTKEVFIYEDEARPVYPYPFSIVNTPVVKLSASTANPFAPLKSYRMEMDTTEWFNSPLKVSQTLSGTGGLLAFDPGLTLRDSTVYYWRVAPVPGSGDPIWNGSSFIYLSGSGTGFGQHHFYQHLRSKGDGMRMDPIARYWRYDSVPHFIFAKNGVFGSATGQEGDMIVAPDGDPYMRNACTPSSLAFNVFDPLSFSPMVNRNGDYGSTVPCAPSRQWNFEFNYQSVASRKRIMDFMDSLPAGKIIVVRTILTTGSTTGFIDEWKSDTTLYGSGVSLYHKLRGVGMDKLDSFTSRRVLIFIYQKGNPAFGPMSVCSNGMYDLVTLYKNFSTLDSVASFESPVFGPAASWQQAVWRGTTDGLADTATLRIYGIRPDGSRQLIRTGSATAGQQLDLSAVNANQYPRIQLGLEAKDNLRFTPYQLRYWQVNGGYIPEGTLAPNLHFNYRDTLELGEPLPLRIAFKNVSPVAFDSLRYKVMVTDRNNVSFLIPTPRIRPLPSSDTVQVSVSIPTERLAGLNGLMVEVNPDSDQPEQFHFNNFFIRPFYVRPDSTAPTIDVTFDGLHILNRDVISSQPVIRMQLTDNARWMLLNDTSLAQVSVRYPGGQLRRFFFRGDTLQFLPSSSAPTDNNRAEIVFLPSFPVDGEYELIVTGKDRSQNSAGSIAYRVSFRVINKPSISQLVNYPNPFTTQTAFVFNLTGKEPPSQFKIEIMTVTGRIVREITAAEIGPLRIGRNITEYRWDGTDQYGQPLANGIYLYRVVASLHGQSLEVSGDSETDKFFSRGYGKMYLMR